MNKFERLFVWSGGTLFVLSLVACAYEYLFVWASPQTGAGRWSPAGAAAIDALLFGVFALHHSLFARDAVKRQVARAVPDRLLRSFYVWTASLLLIIVLGLWQPVAGRFYAVTGWRALAHAAVQIASADLRRVVRPLPADGSLAHRAVRLLIAEGLTPFVTGRDVELLSGRREIG
jgi:hypothetical protein